MTMRGKFRSTTIIKQNFLEKNNNHQKAAKTRRQRGYQWEEIFLHIKNQKKWFKHYQK